MPRFFCSDSTEARLRNVWHVAKASVEAEATPDNVREFHKAHDVLSAYLWNRAQADAAEDRRKHPKAKRNLSKPENTEYLRPGERALP